MKPTDTSLILAISSICLSLTACAHDLKTGTGSNFASFTPDSQFRFLTREEAENFLGERDAFVDAMSAADLVLRFRAADANYVEHASMQARGWAPVHVEKVKAAIALTGEHFKEHGVALPLPGEVLFIQSTGTEEGGAGNYTRRNAIIIPERQMERTAEQLVGVIAHELFHIATRYKPTIRDGLYSIIGFSPCASLNYPKAFLEAKITNPDAFHFDHCIGLEHEGAQFSAMPITIMRNINPDAESMFDNIDIRFLAVTAQGVAVADESGAPVHYSLDEITGFFEQIGNNTGYIVHPEEILADNFSLLIRGKTDVPNPEILTQVRESLFSSH